MKIRNIFPWMGALTLAALWTAHTHAQIDIEPSSSTRQIYQIQSALEGRGVVQPEEKEAWRMTVEARFQYDERIIARTKQLKSIRNYDQALAKIRIDNKPLTNQLSDDKSVIIVQAKGADQPIKMASLGGPITQSQFELINTHGNTLILSEIFKKRSVEEGDSWEPNDQILANFLNIDSVDETDVEIEVASIEGKIAKLVIGGDTRGIIDGAETDISLNGNVEFDTSLGIVTDANITISQHRDIGLVAPGLDATFKMITKIRPINDSQYLTDQGLASLRKSSGQITDDLLLEPEGSPVSLVHPRKWRVISNHKSRTILRYSQRGRTIGQCDIIPLPDQMPNQQPTLEQFRSVVKNKLEDSSGEIKSANQARTSSGLTWMRVEATGATDGVNMHWTYYTISSPDGRRVQLIFTTEPSYAASFGSMERYLIDSLQFEALAEKPAAGETPAAKVSSNKLPTKKQYRKSKSIKK